MEELPVWHQARVMRSGPKQELTESWGARARLRDWLSPSSANLPLRNSFHLLHIKTSEEAREHHEAMQRRRSTIRGTRQRGPHLIAELADQLDYAALDLVAGGADLL
jgi:hypothetical protein